MCACGCVFTQIAGATVKTRPAIKPNQRTLICIRTRIDCVMDQWNPSMLDSFPLAYRITGCALIELFGLWFSKMGRSEAIDHCTGNLTQFGRGANKPAFLTENLLQMTPFFAHTALNLQSARLHPTSQALTEGGNRVVRMTGPDDITVYSFWDKAERNQKAATLLLSVSITFFLFHIHSHTDTFVLLRLWGSLKCWLASTLATISCSSTQCSRFCFYVCNNNEEPKPHGSDSSENYRNHCLLKKPHLGAHMWSCFCKLHVQPASMHSSIKAS